MLPVCQGGSLLLKNCVRDEFLAVQGRGSGGLSVIDTLQEPHNNDETEQAGEKSKGANGSAGALDGKPSQVTYPCGQPSGRVFAAALDGQVTKRKIYRS